MDIARERRQMRDLFDVRLALCDRAVKMRDAPAGGDLEVKQRRERLRRGERAGITPGAEGHEQLPCLIEREIPVHHRRNAHRFDRAQRDAVFFFYVFAQIRVAGAHALQDLVLPVGPDAVDEAVLPVERAGSERQTVFVGQHRLDARRAELYPEEGFAVCDFFCDVGHDDSPCCIILILIYLDVSRGVGHTW